MQSLALPRPTSLLSTPLGRPAEPEDGLAKFRSKLSPSSRPEQQGYPSPPMSEPHSPSRRPAQSVESARLSYPAPVHAPHRLEGPTTLPPPSSSLFDPRSTPAAQGNLQQRPLYPGEPQHRGQALHYQPGRGPEHFSYGNVQLSPNYAYNYPTGGLSHYAGAQHGVPMVQQATMIAPPPARPAKTARRTKAHVASACVNCKKAHLSCDVQRPCGRCVASGKQDTCKDVQHKKRGRPRLRDDRDFSRPEEGRASSQMLGPLPVSEAFAHQAHFPAPHSHRPADPLRVLKSTTQGFDTLNTTLHTTTSSSGGQANNMGIYGARLPVQHGSGPNVTYESLPVAYLNLDLVIQKSNQAFADLVGFLGNVRGKHLGELLETRQSESLQRLRNELRDERDEREPTYMAPITPVGKDPMHAVMDSVADQDIDNFTQGNTDRPMFLSFRLPGHEQYQSLQVQIRLAKTSLYFVTLVVRSPPRLPAPPALLTQQLAPPTPRHTSHTMSAPTAAPITQFTPQQARPPSSASSAPNSPFFNLSSVRTSLPTFSPSSYSSSPSYGYSPTTGAEPGYFPTYQPPPQPATSAYPSPYTSVPRTPSVTSEPLREVNRPARLEGLHLPPIRTGPAPLGSPLHVESSIGAPERVRRRESPSSAERRRPETPDETGKRRRLNIHEMLE